MGLVIVILIAALLLGVLGFIIKGLLWLVFIAVVLLIAAFVVGWVQSKARGRGAGV